MSYGIPASSSKLAAEPKHKGTLACVVLKAKNLPNKRSIGKQDPFAVLSIGDEKQKTKPDKRGGQHPTWDEQLHFEIYDDAEDVIAGGDAAGGTTGASPSSTVVRKAGKKVLKVTCYADDNKEPDYIAEGLVDLTDVLKTGEFDEWVTIRHKDRYCGEVYLELTFFSAAPRPRKAKKPRPVMDSTTGASAYGGAGTFTADVGDDFGPPRPDNQPRPSYSAVPPSMRPGGHQARLSASSSFASGMYAQPYGDEGAVGMRPSQSFAGLAATYTPPYAPAAAVQQRPTSPQPPPLPPQSYTSHSGMTPSATMPAVDHHRTNSNFAPDASGYAGYAVGPTPGRDSGIPSSYSQSFSGVVQIPTSHSSATIRPASTQPPDHDPINDLIRPMSSMSVGSMSTAGRPLPPSMPTVPYQQGDYRYSATPTPQPQTRWEQQPQQHQQHQQHQHYQQQPTSARIPSYQRPDPAPTPPPPSHSAPPHLPYPHSSHQGQYGQQPPPPRDDFYDQYGRPPSSQQVHPAQTFVPATLAHSLNHPPTPSQDPRYRPSSPAAPPPRPVSSSSYHALPAVPSQAPPSAYRAASPQPQAYHYATPQQEPAHPPQNSYYDQHQQGRAPSPAPQLQSAPYYAAQQPAYPEHAQPPQHTYRPQAQYSRPSSPSKSSRPLPPTSPGIRPPSPGYHPSVQRGPHDPYHPQDGPHQSQGQPQGQPGPPNGYGGYGQPGVPASSSYYSGVAPAPAHGGSGSGGQSDHGSYQRDQSSGQEHSQSQSQPYPYGAPSPYDRAPTPTGGGAARHQYQQRQQHYEERPVSPQPHRPQPGVGGYTASAAPASQLLNSYPSGPVHQQQYSQQSSQQPSYYR